MVNKIGVVNALHMLGVEPAQDLIHIPAKIIIRYSGQIKGFPMYNISGIALDHLNCLRNPDTNTHFHELIEGVIEVEPDRRWKAQFPNGQDTPRRLPGHSFLGTTVDSLLTSGGGLDPYWYDLKWDFQTATWVDNPYQEEGDDD